MTHASPLDDWLEDLETELATNHRLNFAIRQERATKFWDYHYRHELAKLGLRPDEVGAELRRERFYGNSDPETVNTAICRIAAENDRLRGQMIDDYMYQFAKHMRAKVGDNLNLLDHALIFHRQEIDQDIRHASIENLLSLRQRTECLTEDATFICQTDRTAWAVAGYEISGMSQLLVAATGPVRRLLNTAHNWLRQMR